MVWLREATADHKMADRTELFKATVKSFRLMKSRLEKVIEDNVNLSSSTKEQNASLDIFSKKLECSRFSRSATETVLDISKMRQFLLKSRQSYIGRAGVFGSMSEGERDAIEEAAESFMKNCSESVHSLHKQIYSDGLTGEQITAHRKAVVEILRNYLRGVCQLYSEQRAVRVKRSIERRQNARLHSGKPFTVSTCVVGSPDSRTAAPSGTIVHGDGDGDGDGDGGGGGGDNGSNGDNCRKETGNGSMDRAFSNPVSVNPQPDSMLTTEEVDTFQQENVQLLEQFHDVTDEVRVIQEKVLEISELQRLFTGKVMAQADGIEIVAENAVTSTVNVTAGNEEMRQAIKSRATYRAVILFVLIMLSVTLLFLNWYG